MSLKAYELLAAHQCFKCLSVLSHFVSCVGKQNSSKETTCNFTFLFEKLSIYTKKIKMVIVVRVRRTTVKKL